MAKPKSLEVKKSKTIFNNTTIIDRNFIENPLFICNLKEELSTMQEIENNYNLSTEAKKAIKTLSQNQNKETLSVVYRSWSDSSGDKKELLIVNSFPTFQTSDVWNGLIGLYLKKITPVAYDDEEKSFSIEYDTMEFSLYELAKFMNKSVGGKSLDMLDSEIMKLENAKYYNFSTNVIFDKKNEEYLDMSRKGISLVSSYQKNVRKNKNSSTTTDKCSIQFNRVIIDNIRYEFFKYMNPSIYFSLPSRGLTRRLYTYVIGTPNTANTEVMSYIKRNIFLLADKLPIYPQSRSKIKEKLNIGLKYLKENNIIMDYFYGDETLVNGIKEDVVYFITKGTKYNVLEHLSNKQLELAITIDVDFEESLYIPKDIKEELISIGVTELKAIELIKNYDKWKITKYILWLKEESKKIKQNTKTSNPAGLIIFAIESGLVKLESNHQYIIDFVEKEKSKQEKKKELTEENIKVLYQEYLDAELRKFKLEDEFGYNVLFENILNSLNFHVDKKIAQLKLLISNSNKSEEIEEFNRQLNNQEEFKEKQEKSLLFKNGFRKESMVYRQLKNYNDFKMECMKK